ncbi:MAG: hypothetical protein JO001_18250 [Alphaproteobacteria bacterium]|nr:hypothetical protein [Alphaproteobacteria bacterium]
MAAAQPQMPAGSKNFNPPGSVPNYFSNEAGAIRGGVAAVPPPGASYIVPSVRPRSYASADRSARMRVGRYRVVARSRHASRHGHAVSRARERERPRVAHVRTVAARSSAHSAHGGRSGRRR